MVIEKKKNEQIEIDMKLQLKLGRVLPFAGEKRVYFALLSDVVNGMQNSLSRKDYEKEIIFVLDNWNYEHPKLVEQEYGLRFYLYEMLCKKS